MKRHPLLLTAILLSLLMVGCSGKKGTVVTPPTASDSVPPDELGPTEVVEAPGTGAFESEGPEAQPLEEEAGTSPLQDIYFEFDRYDLKPEARRTLRLNAAWLKSHPDTQVVLEGHCDERGTEEYNLALGDRRAHSARKYLIDLGIGAERMFSISYGESRPVDRRSSEEAWARNRRVHFRIKE